MDNMEKDNDNGFTFKVPSIISEHQKLILAIAVAILLPLGIAEVVVGAIYVKDCSLEKMVPVFLIVSGCLPLVFGGFCKRGGEDIFHLRARFGVIAMLFNLIWQIGGTVWVYPTWITVIRDENVPCPDNVTAVVPTGCTEGSCNAHLLKFSTAIVTLNWIWMGLIIAIGANIMMVPLCKSKET